MQFDHPKSLFLTTYNKMLFIPFFFTAATLTIFNSDAYATPAKMSSLDNAGQAKWCDGYSDLTCSIHCKRMGFKKHTCSTK